MAYFSKSSRDVAATGDLGQYIGTGQVSGQSNSGFGGQSNTISDVPQDVWEGFETVGLAELDYPTAGEQWQIRSTSANDSFPSGTGAREVSVTFMEEATRSYIGEFLSLNGTTPVQFTSSDAFRPNRAVCLIGGSGRENDGNIIIERTSDSKYRGGILAGLGGQSSGRFTVPSGFTLGIIGRFYDVPKDSDCRIRVRTAVNLESFNCWFDFGNFDAYQNPGEVNAPESFLAIPAGAEFRITATASNPNSTLQLNFSARLIDNKCLLVENVDMIKGAWENQTPMHLNKGAVILP